MATNPLPPTMRRWTFNSTTAGLENNLTLDTSAPLPKPKPNEHLIRVHAVGLNPVDFKPFEAPVIGRLLVRKPITPGLDFAGRIVTPADNSPFEPGQLVFGTASTNPLAGEGALADYIAAPAATVAALPKALESKAVEMAGIPIAAITAHASLQPSILPGAKVFINGASGGVGTYSIQLAKTLGAAHVTVSCSPRNAELCRRLGADEVLNYTAARPLLDQLRETVETSGRAFDHIVDNVFSDPALYFRAHEYAVPGARFAEVASAPSVAFLRFAVAAFGLPAFLGGGRRKCMLVAADVRTERLEEIAALIAEGEVKMVTDEVFEMERAREAFRKLKTGRARGKIVVDVAGADAVGEDGRNR